MPLGATTVDLWAPDQPGRPPPTVAEKRNALVAQAQQAGARYIFFLGDDTLPPPHALMQLLQTAQRGNYPIVTGVYTSRSSPPQPFIWRGYLEGSYYDWHIGEVFEIAWAGCDLLLVNMEVFNNTEAPWFDQGYVFEPGDSALPRPGNTEDIFFFQKAAAAGYKAWCDAGVIGLHQDRHTGIAYGIPKNWPQMIPGSVIPEVEDGYLIADIGAGRDSWFPPMGSRLVRFDIDESVNPDVRCDIRKLPEPDQRFDEFWSRHVLEHFTQNDAPMLIKEWCRILKVGGKARINVPNFQMAIEAILKGPGTVTEYNWWQVYGEQKDAHDFHKNGFTQHMLKRLLETAWGAAPVHGVDADGKVVTGQVMQDINVEVVGARQENLEVTAVKAIHPTPIVIGPKGEFTEVPVPTDVPHPQAATEAVAGTPVNSPKKIRKRSHTRAGASK